MTTERDEIVGEIHRQLRASNREAVRVALGKIVEVAKQASKSPGCMGLARYVRSRINSSATNKDDSPFSLMRSIVERLQILGMTPERAPCEVETVRSVEVMSAEVMSAMLLELDQDEAVALVLAIYLAVGGDPKAAAARAQGYNDSVQYTHVLCAAKNSWDEWEALDPMRPVDTPEPFRPGTSSFGTWVALWTEAEGEDVRLAVGRKA